MSNGHRIYDPNVAVKISTRGKSIVAECSRPVDVRFFTPHVHIAHFGIQKSRAAKGCRAAILRVSHG